MFHPAIISYIAGISWLATYSFNIFVTFSYCRLKISCVFSLTFGEPVYFALTAIADLLCILPVTYRRMVVVAYYVILNQMFLYIYNMYISYFTNYSGKYLVKLTLSRNYSMRLQFLVKNLAFTELNGFRYLGKFGYFSQHYTTNLL